MGQEGQQQQADAEEGKGVAVTLEIAHLLHHEDGPDERRHSDRRPHRLRRGLTARETGDEDVADAIEEPGDRQENRVGVGRPPAESEMSDEEQGEDQGEERADVGGQRAGLALTRQRVEAPDQDDVQEDQPELGPSPRRAAVRGHDRRRTRHRGHVVTGLV
jgi:hypothetical protein